MLLYADSVLFYTTVRFYASTMLLYADWQFCVMPLYLSTHLRFYGSLLLHDWTILRIYDATVRRLAVLFYTTVRFYASTFLRLTLLLHDWTILCIYDATVRRRSVLFYPTVRFYASTMLLYADWQFCFVPLYVSLRIYVSTAHFGFTPLYDSTHLRCYCTPTVSVVLYHCTFLRMYVSTAHLTL